MRKREFKGCKGGAYSHPDDYGYDHYNINPKVSITFQEGDFKILVDMAKKQNVSFAEIVRRCVSQAIGSTRGIKEENGALATPHRSREEISAYSEFLEACQDECATVVANKEVQAAIVKMERQISSLHRLEDVSIRLAKKMSICDFTDPECTYEDEGYWKIHAEFHKTVQEIAPTEKIKTIYDNRESS